MINNATINKLNEMRLTTMAESYRHQLHDATYESLSFEERFSLMVDTEWARRKNNRLKKLIRRAELLQSAACIENIEYHGDRKLDKATIARLATCNYIQDKHNIILGASGSGKTYLACAFGVSACRNFFTVKYIRLPDLLVEIAMSRGEGTYREYMKKLKKVKLLILDEWMLYPLKENETIPRIV